MAEGVLPNQGKIFAWNCPEFKQDMQDVTKQAGFKYYFLAYKYIMGIDLTEEETPTESKIRAKCTKKLRKLQMILLVFFAVVFTIGSIAITTNEVFSRKKLTTSLICSYITIITPQMMVIFILFHLVIKVPKLRSLVQNLSALVIRKHGQWYINNNHRKQVQKLFTRILALETAFTIIEVLMAIYANRKHYEVLLLFGSMKSVPLTYFIGALGIVQFVILKMASSLYRVGFVTCCQVLSLAFDALKDLTTTKYCSLARYQYHHRYACNMVLQNNALFSNVLFLSLITDFVYIVINAKILFVLSDIEPIIFTTFIIFRRICASGMKCIYASKVNKKVKTTLQDALTGRTLADMASFDKEEGNYLLYLTTLSVDYPAITYGGLFAAKKEIFLSFGGTVLSYIFLIKDMTPF